ncbi:MAG: PorT family protein [Muribaculaceae bacterium]|nr:PorT family protein [Muribaculaceae bacterium]
MSIYNYRHIAIVALLLTAFLAVAQDNDKILNRQYADMKRVHYGFSVGVNFQDLKITNNGYISEDGQAWFADIPSHSPGFCVNVLADLRLSTHFNLRISPGMYFGNKVVRYFNANAPEDALEPSIKQQRQNVKATYIVLPIDLKFSARRHHNIRPYFTGGVTGLYDLSKERPEQLRLKDFDVMLTVGMGCDFYLPFFKLCPEVKFCFGLKNLLEKNRPDLQDNPAMEVFTKSVSKLKNNMVVLTFYFE